MKILVTGGMGYIGSHTCLELHQAGHEVVILDNLSNSKLSVLDRLEKISEHRFPFIHADLRDAAQIDAAFSHQNFEAVIHFAGLKAVGESVEQPLRYYQNNVTGTLNLLEAMQKHDVKQLVFSSSATVYGDPARLPIDETFPLSVTNPYGRSKLIVEDMLRDVWRSDPSWKIAMLRYFNPVGAHVSGLIGEDPNGIPNNLLPYIAQVAQGERSQLAIFGDDYPTQDGTGVRDFIHVVDLALGHVKTLAKLNTATQVLVYNLGTGRGYSVLEMKNAFAKASGKSIPFYVTQRRPGDIAACYANPDLAWQELGWRAERGLDEMCMDAWRWQQNQGSL